MADQDGRNRQEARTMNNSENDRLPEAGEIITSGNGSFALMEVLGSGGFGRVFRAICNPSDRILAVKVEVFSRKSLKNENAVLRAAAAHACTRMCEVFDYGRVYNQFRYLAMTLLGDDINHLRKARTPTCFTLSTAVRVGIQTMQGIEELHGCGYISRDIKPSNFAIGNATEELVRHVFIFDFGLCRRYTRDGALIPSRGRIGWRGTARYASLNADRRQDMSRKDDIEGWLYTLVVITNGALPWQYTRDRAEVRRVKEASRRAFRAQLFENCPNEYDEFLTCIDEMEFDSTPPYEYFYKGLNEIMAANNISADGPFDWEACETMSSPSSNEHCTADRSTQNELTDVTDVTPED